MFGELNQNEIEELLHQQVIGRIGCHADNSTYVVPISYAYDGEYIYGHTQEGMKIKMMRKNRHICFEVDSLHDLANWKSVISWGEFEEITQEPERNQALQRLHDRILPIVSSVTTKLSPEWPFTPNNTGDIKGIIFRVRLTKKTGRFENSSVPSFLAWG
ncbi:MAG: pyridoxamine 5'-phosphate oxidase family protein [Chitinophagales bacterium]